jgi:hypothetical protein
VEWRRSTCFVEQMDVLGRYSSLPIAHQQAPKKRGRKKKEGDRGKMKTFPN